MSSSEIRTIVPYVNWVISTPNSFALTKVRASFVMEFRRANARRQFAIAASVARSFERIEERLDEAESRLLSRLRDLDDKIEAVYDSGIDPNKHN